MAKVIEYIAEVLPDGHLSVPDDVRQAVASAPNAEIQVTIRLHEFGARDVEDAWKVFRELGRDASPGRLPEAAADHDRYLYNKT